MNAIDLMCNDYPVCPHCGEKMHNAEEIYFNLSECAEVDCDTCLKRFIVIRNVRIDYTTNKLEGVP